MLGTMSVGGNVGFERLKLSKDIRAFALPVFKPDLT